MQVGSSTTISAQLQGLENAAVGKYQGGQDFSFLLQMVNGSVSDASGSSSSNSSGSGSTGTSSPSAGSTASNGYLMSGSFQAETLVAVGTMTPGGQMTPFSQQQVQSEEAAVNTGGKAAYSNALQNFLTLSQAGGQMGAASLSDHKQFVADNGLIAGSFDTSFSLKPE